MGGDRDREEEKEGGRDRETEGRQRGRDRQREGGRDRQKDRETERGREGETFRVTGALQTSRGWVCPSASSHCAPTLGSG